MRHIQFDTHIDTIHRRLPFFLATEEWVARRLPADEYFFCWQVDPTVICGRNQEINKEVDLHYCADNGIDVVRRRSGGGAVFADRENFMFSYITPGDEVTTEFAHYTSLIAQSLRNIGIEAEATGRNDITINGKKVAGNAFYHLPGRCIAHGTMLYNFDPKHIANALTPSRAKLESKGVKSVPSRVTCLKNEGVKLSTGEFEQYMINSITDGNPYIINEADLQEIMLIEQQYYAPGFLKIGAVAPHHDNIPGENHESTTSADNERVRCFSRRIPDVGEFNIRLTTDSANRITALSITGDFMTDGEVTDITTALIGTEYTQASIRAVIATLPVGSIITGLTDTTLLCLLLPNSKPA